MPPRRSTDSGRPLGVSRREFLRFAGAATAAGTLAGCGAVPWNRPAASGGEARAFGREADVLVVGTGAAGCTAALFAAEAGAEVIVLEKALLVGGTTAKSGGVYFIPNSRFERERPEGLWETREETLRAWAEASFPLRYRAGQPRHGLDPRDFALLEALYDNGPAAVEGLEKMGALRSMLTADAFGALPDYIDKRTETGPLFDRRLWARKPDGSFGLGDEMIRQLKAALDARGVPVLTGHGAQQILTNAAGEVVGLEARKMDGSVVRLRARRGVVFASGGYTHDRELIANFQPGPVVGGCASPENRGDFVRMAQALGAKLGHMNSAWRAQVVLEQALQFSSTPDDVFMPPGDSMLLVNRLGERVVNEKTNYNERTRVHQAWDPFRKEYVNEILMMVYDQRTAELFGGRFPLPAAGASAPYVIKADSLSALAGAIDARLERLAPRTGDVRLEVGFADRLAASVDRFNRFARRGVDDDFHRGAQFYDREWHLKIWSFPNADQLAKHPLDKPNPTLYPLAATGPYHAILLGSGTLDTNGGPVIDPRAQVVDAADRPVPGLYGAGNCIASPTGQAYYAGGATLGACVVFGFLAGRSAATAPERELS